MYIMSKIFVIIYKLFRTVIYQEIPSYKYMYPFPKTGFYVTVTF